MATIIDMNQTRERSNPIHLNPFLNTVDTSRRSIKEIATQIRLTEAEGDQHPITREDVAKLFVMLLAQFGYSWQKLYPDAILEAALGEWYQTLKMLTKGEFKRGIDKCRKSANLYPPGAKEFRGWCLPSKQDLGFESAEIAYQAAARGEYINELSNRIVKEIGHHEWRMGRASELRRQFIRRYNQLLDAIYEQF